MRSPALGVAVPRGWLDPAGCFELIQEHRLQQGAVVPLMLQILLSQPLGPPAGTSTLWGMRGYWTRRSATAQALRDGWLLTGEIGYQAAGGTCSTSTAIRGGFNLYPVTRRMRCWSTLVGVVGRTDSDRGEEVVAFVSLRAGQIRLRGS